MKILVRLQVKFWLLIFVIGSLVWKCDETNSKLLLRKIFFEIFLAPLDLMNENCKRWFSPHQGKVFLSGICGIYKYWAYQQF